MYITSEQIEYQEKLIQAMADMQEKLHKERPEEESEEIKQIVYDYYKNDIQSVAKGYISRESMLDDYEDYDGDSFYQLPKDVRDKIKEKILNGFSEMDNEKKESYLNARLIVCNAMRKVINVSMSYIPLDGTSNCLYYENDKILSIMKKNNFKEGKVGLELIPDLYYESVNTFSEGFRMYGWCKLSYACDIKKGIEVELGKHSIGKIGEEAYSKYDKIILKDEQSRRAALNYDDGDEYQM